MAAVTKGSGKYFYDNDRVWEEARQTGVDPFIVGNFGGRIPIPKDLTPDYVRDLCQGRPLPRVQANRVGCYDVTFTFSKSVSVALFGLTPHDLWAEKSTKLLVDATRPEVARLVNDQRANSGAKGARKVEPKGAAFGFVHWESSRKVVHGHVHYAIPNVTSPEKGSPKSIAKVREQMYETQGLMRARANKRLDDMLQDRGFKTVREGKTVAIAGVPKKLVEELSPSRRAMNQAMKKMEGLQKSFGYSFTNSHSVTRSTNTGESSSWSPQGGSRTRSSGSSFSVSDSTSKTHSENFSLVVKDAVLAGEVTNLPYASEAEDLIRGFAFSPEVGAFRFEAPFLDHFRNLPEAVVDSMPLRPASDQRLLPWTTADLERLRLEPTPDLISAVKNTWDKMGDVK